MSSSEEYMWLVEVVDERARGRVGSYCSRLVPAEPLIFLRPLSDGLAKNDRGVQKDESEVGERGHAALALAAGSPELEWDFRSLS